MQILLYLAAVVPPTCQKSFLGFPPWYKYLPGADVCQPEMRSIMDIWLIGAAILEILLRVASIAALVYVVWGGIEFITSQGEPDKTAKARHTVINALIGLVISIGAASIVSFVAGRFR